MPKWLNRNVAGAGLTSLLSDASHEMGTSILPGFLTTLGAPAFVLGLIEGVSDALSSFSKLLGGWISDRFGHRKFIISLGYFITGISMSLFAIAQSWVLVFVGRAFGWLARGFRGPARDAILSDSAPPEFRGKAFGFHRAGDTIGAIIGPLLGVGLMSLWQPFGFADQSLPFRYIFLVTLIPGLAAAIAFVVIVRDEKYQRNDGLEFWKSIKSFPAGFRKYLLAIGIFGLGDFAPTLLILAAASLLTPAYGALKAAQLAGLMYVVRNVVYAAASFPIGALSDRRERKTVLTFGYVVAAITLAGFMLTFIFNFANIIFLFILFSLAGIFISAEDTLEPAITADMIQPNLRGTAMGMLGTINGIGDFVSSSLVGLVWTLVSPAAALATAAGFMTAGTLLLSRK
jgi:MFS family permease